MAEFQGLLDLMWDSISNCTDYEVDKDVVEENYHTEVLSFIHIKMVWMILRISSSSS